MDHALRRRRLAEALGDLDALFVTRLTSVRYLTGFSGSNGQVLVTREGALLFTDGRYQEQARHESPDLEAIIYLDGVPPVIGEPTSRFGVRRLGFEGAFLSFAAASRPSPAPATSRRCAPSRTMRRSRSSVPPRRRPTWRSSGSCCGSCARA